MFSSASRRLLYLAILTLAATGCESSKPDITVRQWTDDMAFRITVEPMPPVALEQALYTISVRDKKTGVPIIGGEGRIFATSQDGANTDNNLVPGNEPGVYTGKLFYVTSGDWAIALQFRRDSTKKLERMDWMQNVKPAAEPGQ